MLYVRKHLLSILLRSSELKKTPQAPSTESIKYAWYNKSCEDSMQMCTEKTLRFQLFNETHALTTERQQRDQEI